MELTCGLRDGVSGNGTGKRHMVMGTVKLEASWFSFFPVRDKMLNKVWEKYFRVFAISVPDGTG